MTYDQYRKTKPGDSVRFNKRIRDFFRTESYGMCTVNGKLETLKQAQDWFIRQAIGFNLKYSAKIVRLSPEVGDGPGALVDITVVEYSDTTFIGYKDLIYCKKKKRSK